ncbi:hypothetical protein [Stutzerimonas stutzeri]|uniref:hypothetical protein n=1 Tax=Stutzerimonas stutzeri TaxID=316 RepID=UPI000D2159F4|nr:hypothetical protein [Stutzerimonas stutzeri]AVX13324.1 hypothetical protein CXB48_11265 [Stutzerimonas stutzeri]
MNTVKQWMRATRALGFALVLVVDPASAMAIADSLSIDPVLPDVHGSSSPSCDNAGSPSPIAYSESSNDSALPCATTSGSQGTSQSPGHPGHRVVEPASGSFWYAPTDSRRYSF